GRNFFISRYLTLRPHFGLKFGWIDQDYHVKVDDFSVFAALQSTAGATIGIVPPSEGSAKMDQDFFGVGIRTGLDAVWYFTKHWGLYGDFAISAMWSDFHSKREDHIASNAFAKVECLDFKRTLTTLTEVLELGLGFRYDCTFFLGDYEFYLQAGWEEQIWFNQNQFLDTVDTRTGNLTFHGLTVKAGLMF
ncbi:MAG: MOMP family protein, partial [Verrucomicrobia bacterium]|nr:MOMP family protein [Verrucomicrobiota bacterium]